jgi:polyisoprenoid-binding protein YceI
MPPVKKEPAQFVIDAGASLLTVQAFASGIAAVVAHSPKFAMRDFSGDVLFDSDAIEQSSIQISVRLASLEIMDEVSTLDRREIERVMFEEVLEKTLYPKTEFRSSHIHATKVSDNVYRARISGDVSLHGVTRGLGFDSQVVLGEDTIRAQGAFSMMQTDFGLKIASVADGALKLKDELKFGFFLIARRKE